MRCVLGMGAMLIGLGAVAADSAPDNTDAFAQYADPTQVVAAVKANFEAAPGTPVRFSVYDSEDAFLEIARVKHQARVDENGVAAATFIGLEPGEYAFAAYLDENRDGILNRGSVLGRPKEPIAFSNGVVPKLRKPRFDETKVSVAPGTVVVITLED